MVSRSITTAAIRQPQHQAITHCILNQSLWPTLRAQIEERLFFLDLQAQLNSTPSAHSSFQIESWLPNRIREIGIEELDDLELLEESDLLPPQLDEYELHPLKKEFPPRIELSDAQYQVEYNVSKKRAVLHQISGSRRQPPLTSWLPKCNGFEIRLKQGQHESTLRPRRR